MSKKPTLEEIIANDPDREHIVACYVDEDGNVCIDYDSEFVAKLAHEHTAMFLELYKEKFD